MNHHQASQHTLLHSHVDHQLEALGIPNGHVGPYVLSSGRMIYWTGRVAIGLRHQPYAPAQPMTQGGVWLQAVMLRARRPLGGWVPA